MIFNHTFTNTNTSNIHIYHNSRKIRNEFELMELYFHKIQSDNKNLIFYDSPVYHNYYWYAKQPQNFALFKCYRNLFLQKIIDATQNNQ